MNIKISTIDRHLNDELIAELREVIPHLTELNERTENGETTSKRARKKTKEKTDRTRRWRFACRSRFYATRFWHCDFVVMREHARANKSILFPAQCNTYPLSLSATFICLLNLILLSLLFLYVLLL